MNTRNEIEKYIQEILNTGQFQMVGFRSPDYSPNETTWKFRRQCQTATEVILDVHGSIKVVAPDWSPVVCLKCLDSGEEFCHPVDIDAPETWPTEMAKIMGYFVKTGGK